MVQLFSHLLLEGDIILLWHLKQLHVIYDKHNLHVRGARRMLIENAFFSPHHHSIVQYFYELSLGNTFFVTISLCKLNLLM